MFKFLKRIIHSFLKVFDIRLHRLSNFKCIELNYFINEEKNNHGIKIIKYLEIDCLLDVGANIGQYASLVRSLGYEGQIFSFEPLSSAHRILKEKSIHDNFWTVYDRCGIGDHNKVEAINISGNSYSSSFLAMLDNHKKAEPNSKYLGQEEVKIHTLDSIFKNFNSGYKRIFLKIDTQGYEMNVLKGVEKNIHKIYAVQLELSILPLYDNSHLYQDFFDYFIKRGFECWNLQSGFRNPETGRLLQFDGLFVNKNLINQN